jgi:hypothetical protein
MLKQDKVDQILTIICNGPDSMAGRAVGWTVKDLVERAWQIWAKMKKRRLNAAKKIRTAVEEELYEYSWGKGFEHQDPAAYKAARATAKKEIAANKLKRTAVNASMVAPVVEPRASADEPEPEIEADFVWLQARVSPQVDELRACVADLGDRTPEIGDEVAVTGFEGTIWWAGEIISIEARGSKRHCVLFAGDARKFFCGLLCNRYGPAKVVKRREGGKEHLTAGWVFLVPTEEAPARTAVPCSSTRRCVSCTGVKCQSSRTCIV